MNFVIVEGGSSFRDRKEDFVKLYNQGCPSKDIQKLCDLSAGQYLKLVRECAEEKLIMRRRFPKGKKKHEPKYYYFSRALQRWIISKKSRYYGSYPSEDLAKRGVEVCKEHDWDISPDELRWILYEED